MKFVWIIGLVAIVIFVFFIFSSCSEGVKLFSSNSVEPNIISVTPLLLSTNTSFCATCPSCSLNCCNVACPNIEATCQYNNGVQNTQVVLAMNYAFSTGFPTTATSFISYWQDSSNSGRFIPNRLYNKQTNTFYLTTENCYLKSGTNSYNSVLQFNQNNDCSTLISATEPMNSCSAQALDYIVLTTISTGPTQIKNTIVQMNGVLRDVPSYPYGIEQKWPHTAYPQVSLCFCGYAGADIYSQCQPVSTSCLTSGIKAAGLFSCSPESKPFIANNQALYIPLMFYTKDVSVVQDIRIYRWITPLSYDLNIRLQCYGRNNLELNSQIFYSENLSDGRYFCILNNQNSPSTFTTGDIFSIFATFSNGSGFSTGVVLTIVVGATSEDTVYTWISSNPFDGLPNPGGVSGNLNFPPS
jgi:hypothetical protein